MAKRYRKRSALTKRQKAEVRRIAYRQGGETKYTLISSSAQPIDSSVGYNVFLPAIPQGTDQGYRISDEINLDRLVLRGCITFPDTSNVVRVIVASQPAAGTFSLLPFYTGVGTAVDEKANGIKVWRDFYLTGGAGGVVATKFSLNIPFKRKGQKGMKITYNATGGTSLVEGAPHLCLFFISDSGTVSHPTVTMTGKLYYHDN